MNLIIGKTSQDVANRFHVPIEWLGDKSVHLFIASSMWDTLFKRGYIYHAKKII